MAPPSRHSRSGACSRPSPSDHGSRVPADPSLTVRDQLLARADDARDGLLAGNERWSWAEVVRCSAVRSALLAELLPDGRPPHVGVLLDNVPEFAFLLGGAALGGQVVVGLNSTRQGAALAADVATRRRAGGGDRRRSRRAPACARRAGAARRLSGVVRPAGAAPRRRGARHRHHRRHPAHADLHVRHVRRAEGRQRHPHEGGLPRTVPLRTVRPGRGRRRLPVDADVPLQRDHGRVGTSARGRSHDRARAEVLGLGLPARRPPLRRDVRQLRGKAACLRDGHALRAG